MKKAEGKILPLRRLEGAPAEMSDEALVAACGVGDPSALGALFDRHYRSVHGFLARVSGARGADLDDLLQTTFEQAWGAAARFRGNARAKTWLLGIAVNVARHHVRGAVRARVALEAVRTLPVRPDPRPDETLDHKERLERFSVALAALPYDLCAAFVLCEVEGLAGIEAARALGVREGTLWRRLHEARRILLAAVDGDGDGR